MSQPSPMLLADDDRLTAEIEAALDRAEVLPALTPVDLDPVLGVSPEAAATYMACLALGMSVEGAATKAGLKGGTVRMIINRYREGRYVDGSAAWRMGRYLSECVSIGKAELEQKALQGIAACADGTSKGDWRAWAWLLERLYPERYQLQAKAKSDRRQTGVPESEDGLAEVIDSVRSNLGAGRVRVAVEVT